VYVVVAVGCVLVAKTLLLQKGQQSSEKSGFPLVLSGRTEMKGGIREGAKEQGSKKAGDIERITKNGHAQYGTHLLIRSVN
jgi:hypothetical protein